MNEPTIELVSPADLDRARVAVVVADSADESVARAVRAIQRDRVPQVVVVAARFDESGVVAAVAAGVTGFLRRSEATSARLTAIIHEADRAGCQLPEGLLKRAASVRLRPSVEPDDAVLVVEAAREGGAVTTATELCLSMREAEVLRLVADGYDTTDVAERLSYSESTIKGVLAKVMTRLDARNRCHAVAIVLRQGLI
jgi:DNA-binding NarL/FixJ family response regulator